MKRPVQHLLMIITLTFSLSQAFGQQFVQLAQPPLISVSASAEVKVVPDEIYLRVGVETRDENLQTAKEENDKRVSKSLAFLKRSGIKGKDIQTDFIGIDPNYDNNYARTRPEIYVVRKAIEVKLTKIESFEGILTGLLTNGVNNVQGVQFRTSELRKHRDAARAMALRAAKEKADAMAAALGVKAGKVHSINANDYGGWWDSGSSYWGGHSGGIYQNAIQDAGGTAAEGGTLSVGQISVSASVNVSFLVE